MYTKILDFKVFNGSKDELMKILLSEGNKYHIVSGNPEVLSTAYINPKLLKNFKEDNTIIIPDGIGVKIASHMVKAPVKEKIAGIEIMQEITAYCFNNNKSIYLLGGKEEVIHSLKEKLLKDYPGINISGNHNGYYDKDEEKYIMDDIISKQPFALFVAMGCPRQEEFIIDIMDKIHTGIMMGVGGSFDVLSGKSRRAPLWMINMGLEWLYRVIKEPWRIKRLSIIPKFLFKVALNRK